MLGHLSTDCHSRHFWVLFPAAEQAFMVLEKALRRTREVEAPDVEGEISTVVTAELRWAQGMWGRASRTHATESKRIMEETRKSHAR